MSGYPTRWSCVRDDSCVYCECMSMNSLRSRLTFVKRGSPSAATPSQYLSGSSREPPASALGELMVTIRASPPDQCPHGPLIAQSSCSAPKWFRWSASRGCQHFIQCTPGGSEVDRSIRGWAIILQGWIFDGAAPLGVVTSWQPCLPRQPWVLGLRSTDFPVPSPRG